jgi:O-methyltransferase involved in polyketide biosynthesis
VTLDLSDGPARRALFTRLGATFKRAIVVSEGLLIYLTAEQVGSLADDLSAVPAFRWWLIDLASPQLLKWMSRSWGKHAAKANAPFQFAPAEGTAFFKPHGWRELTYRSSMEEAHRLKREMRGAWFMRLMWRLSSAKKREEFRRFSGFVLLEHA